MTRLLTYTLTVLAAFALAACGAAPTRVATDPPPAAQQGAAPAATLGTLTISDPWVRPANPDAMADTTPMAMEQGAHNATPMAMEQGAHNATPMAMEQGGHDAMPAAVTTGGYMVIANSGAEADALISASVASDLVDVVELHTVTEEGGMMRMRPVEKIEVPAGGEAVLQPGGFHVMFIGVKQELKPGDTLKLTLTFEKAGAVEVDAVVRAANPMP